MEHTFIMTAFGQDRPGIVADVTQVIYEHDCNLKDSSMTRLSDEFAMIFLFSGRGEQLEEQLARAFRRLERERGISAFFRPIPAHTSTAKPGVATRTLHVEGIDQAGIVYHISRYLAAHQINIADLSSHLKFMPQSGTKIYQIEMQIEIPAETSVDGLEQGLTDIADELHVDITF